MKKLFFVTLSILCCFVISIQQEYNPYVEALRRHPWKSEQKYVEVRPGAHLFYWFYYADGTVVNSSHKPLIIWVQGGPGLAATGIANFAEIGPLDMKMKPRYHTWVKGRNVLLIDHPVGTGFSYATNRSLYVTTDREIAIDLSQLIKTFLKWHKEFRQTPAYIFGQSYGGKIAPRLGYYLQSAINKGKLKMNFKGIGIGSGWVNPRESTLIYPHYLYNLGIIDQSTYTKAKNIVKELSVLMDKRDYGSAGLLEMRLFMTITAEAGIDMNFNNINQDSPYPKLEKLAEKINKFVKPTLSHVVNESIVWNYMSEPVFYSLNKSFLVPSTKFLEMLLNNTKIKIAVYNGNLDVVTPIAGAANWAHKLQWSGVNEFKQASVTKIQGTRNGFYKTARQFSFWWVFGSGHWVPEDNPVAMAQILDYMTNDNA